MTTLAHKTRNECMDTRHITFLTKVPPFPRPRFEVKTAQNDCGRIISAAIFALSPFITALVIRNVGARDSNQVISGSVNSPEVCTRGPVIPSQFAGIQTENGKGVLTKSTAFIDL